MAVSGFTVSDMSIERNAIDPGRLLGRNAGVRGRCARIAGARVCLDSLILHGCRSSICLCLTREIPDVGMWRLRSTGLPARSVCLHWSAMGSRPISCSGCRTSVVGSWAAAIGADHSGTPDELGVQLSFEVRVGSQLKTRQLAEWTPGHPVGAVTGTNA